MIYQRKIQLPKDSFFLFGARGTGKTSLLSTAVDAKLSVELLSQESYLKYAGDPGFFRRQLETLSAGSWVWVDEIQRLPELLNEVHWGIEKKKLRFALSGSSARKLRKAGVNLLGGRAISKTLFPFLPSELGEDFSLEKTLREGSIPLVFMADDPQERLRAYVQTYVREEVQAEALVKNLPSFVRFLKIAGMLHGQTLNLSSVARDAGVKRPTIENYFSILEDTLLGYRLFPIEAGLRVKEMKHPKFYWLDPGLVRAIREEWGPLHSLEKGPLFEGLVLTILRAYQSYKNSFDEIFYWASANLEVDFVLKHRSSWIALEVKSSSKFRAEDLNGLRSITSLPRLKKRILLYPEVDHQITSDGIEVWSFKKLMKQLESGIWD